MKDMQTVALYGDTLALATIAASLGRRPGLRVAPAEELGGLQPDVAVFDLAAGRPDIALALWRAQPNLLLIGVDLSTGRALVLSGHPSRVYTVEDLVNVIESHAPARGDQPE